MRYLIDSDWVADYLNGIPNAVREIASLARTGVAISLITYGEIYEGVYYGRDLKAAETVFRQFLRFADVLPLNRAILRQFAALRGDLRRQGLIIADMDTLIAATALHHRLTLLTRNVRHFQRIPNLLLYDATMQ